LTQVFGSSYSSAGLFLQHSTVAWFSRVGLGNTVFMVSAAVLQILQFLCWGVAGHRASIALHTASGLKAAASTSPEAYRPTGMLGEVCINDIKITSTWQQHSRYNQQVGLNLYLKFSAEGAGLRASRFSTKKWISKKVDGKLYRGIVKIAKGQDITAEWRGATIGHIAAAATEGAPREVKIQVKDYGTVKNVVLSEFKVPLTNFAPGQESSSTFTSSSGLFTLTAKFTFNPGALEYGIRCDYYTPGEKVCTSDSKLQSTLLRCAAEWHARMPLARPIQILDLLQADKGPLYQTVSNLMAAAGTKAYWQEYVSAVELSRELVYPDMLLEVLKEHHLDTCTLMGWNN